MLAMWLIPFLCLGLVAAALSVGARRNVARRALDGELVDLLRMDRIADLRARVDDSPLAVRSAPMPSRLFTFSNRVDLDLGPEVLRLRCFWPPTHRVDSVHRIWFTHQVGWVVDTDGPDGPARLYAWSLDVIPSTRVAASPG